MSITATTTRRPRSCHPRGSSTRRGMCIGRSTVSAAAASFGRPRTSEAGRAALTTIGRKSGKQRNVIIGYIEDGPSLVTLAMNGGDEGHPAWWLNLESHRTPLFGWRASTPARCMHALPPARSVTGCGSAGLRSMPVTTPSPDDGRSRLP